MYQNILLTCVYIMDHLFGYNDPRAIDKFYQEQREYSTEKDYEQDRKDHENELS